jgi:hypothetical protein
MFLTIIGGMIFVGPSLGMEKFHREYGAIETKGVVYFSLLTKMVIVSRLLILKSSIQKKQ